MASRLVTKADPVDQIDLALLAIIAPENKPADLILWCEPLKDACRRWDIAEVREVAVFLAQCAHESQGFTRLVENLSYSAGRLMQVWPSRFPTLASAKPYARNPEKLANKVYANRMGNGPETSGDGWRYRGAGAKMLTGKENQSRFAKAIGMPLAKVPAYLQTRDGAAQSAGWFWHEKDLNFFAMTPGVEDETKVINGGFIGIADRRERTNAAIGELLARGC